MNECYFNTIIDDAIKIFIRAYYSCVLDVIVRYILSRADTGF